MANLFNFCVFHPILIRFGLGANFGLKRTWNKLEITKALCRPKADPGEPYVGQRPTHEQPYSVEYIFISLYSFSHILRMNHRRFIYLEYLRVLKSTKEYLRVLKST